MLIVIACVPSWSSSLIYGSSPLTDTVNSLKCVSTGRLYTVLEGCEKSMAHLKQQSVCQGVVFPFQ